MKKGCGQVDFGEPAHEKRDFSIDEAIVLKAFTDQHHVVKMPGPAPSSAFAAAVPSSGNTMATIVI